MPVGFGLSKYSAFCKPSTLTGTLARAAGDITSFSYEPPGLKDLFRDAVQE